MFRAIIAEGELRCASYEMGEHGIDLYDEDERMVAFVPYSTLEALVNEDASDRDERRLV